LVSIYKFGELDVTQLVHAYFIVWQSVCLAGWS